MIAIALEKWNLHKRIALSIINAVGTNIQLIVLGFMLATAFLSMWISNTATSVMMLPIGISIVKQLNEYPLTSDNENSTFGKMLMLGIAYSASIGGIATLIGTPPNLVLAGVISETYEVEISFFQWFIFGFPLSLVLLFTVWFYLTRIAFNMKMEEFPGGREEIKRLQLELGPMRYEEKVVAFLFGLTAFCWISRSYLCSPYFQLWTILLLHFFLGSSYFFSIRKKKDRNSCIGKKLLKCHGG